MGWFSSSPKPEPPTEVPMSEFSDMPAPSAPPPTTTITPNSDSETIKKAYMKQIQLESNTSNVRALMDKINDNCFEKCIPKPGSSLSGSESTCISACVDKYTSAWNIVYRSYTERLRQEAAREDR